MKVKKIERVKHGKDTKRFRRIRLNWTATCVLSAFMLGTALNAAVAAEPDLVIQKVDDGQTWIRGNTGYTYTITVTNAGTANHTGTVMVTDTLPAGLTAAAMSGTGWTCTVSTTTCTRSDTLDSGTNNSYPPITLTVNIGSGAPASVVNNVTVAGNGESDTSNNTATATTAVISPTADVRVTKTNHVGYVVAANPTTYTIRVTNDGPSEVSGVTLKDIVTLDPTYDNLTLNSVTCSTEAGNVCTTAPTVAALTSTNGITLPTLANGAFYEIKVAATAPAFTNNPPQWEHLQVENKAEITVPSLYTDPDTSNNSAIDFDDVGEGTPVNPGLWSESTCLDFTGMPDLAGGASWPTSGYHSVTTPEGMTIYYKVTATSTNTLPIKKYTPGSWRGDRWQQYFGARKTNAILFNRKKTDRIGRFTVSAYAEYNSQVVPLTLLTGSAESDDAPSGGLQRKFSYVKTTTTNGTPWTLVESVYDTAASPSTANNYLEITGTPAAKTVEMSVRTALGNLILISTTKADATATDPLVLDNELYVWSGGTAQGFCVAQAFDRGDAPTSYGRASHLQNLSFAPALANAFYGTKDAVTSDPPITNPIPNAPVAPSSHTTTNMLAGQPSFEATERGTTATEDQDDAITASISIPRNIDTYTLNVPYNNNSAAPVTVSGWIDFDGNGTFDAGEKVTATAAVGSGNVTLSWSGFNLIPTNTATNKTYARFRIGSNAAEVGNPTGSAINGEVEDYVVTIGPPVPKVSIEKETSTTQVVYTSASAGAPVTKTPSEFVYTIVARNATHAGTAQNVQVVDTLPTGLSYVSSTVGGTAASPTQSPSGHLTWNLGSLGANSAQQIAVTVKAPEASDLEASQPYGPWKNTATVNADNATSKTSNEVTTNSVYTKLVKAVHNVGETPAATIPLSSPAWGITNGGKPGEILEYCIDFMNYGSVAVETFTLSDTVPPNTTYVANSAFVKTGDKSSTPITAFPTATVTESGGVVQASISTLAPNTPGSMCFRAKIN